MRLVITIATLAVLSVGLPAGFAGQAPARQTFEGVVTVSPGRDTRPRTSFGGIVVAESNKEPLAGATIALTPHFGNSVLALLAESAGVPEIAPIQTNERGAFFFPDVIAGSYDVVIQRHGYLTTKIGHAGENAGKPVTLSAGERIDDFKVALIRSAQINGRIERTGQSPAGIPVRLVRIDATDTPIAQTTTNADGSYHLEDFSPDRYILIAGSPEMRNGDPPRSFAKQIHIQNTDPFRLDFALDEKGGLRIVGRIGINGLDIPPADVGMTVEAMPQTARRPVAMSDVNFKYDPKSGAFEISDLFPGVYGLHVSLKVPGFCGGAEEGILVSQSDVTGIEMFINVGCN